MTAFAWIIISTAIGVGSLWLYLRAKNQSRQGLPGDSAKRSQPAQSGTGATGRYAAVTIYPCLEACPAAWKLQDVRYVSSEAPTLPLTDCDQATCKCRYRKYDDRRDAEDRRDQWGQFGGFLPQDGNDNRRVGRNRRGKLSHN